LTVFPTIEIEVHQHLKAIDYERKEEAFYIAETIRNYLERM